MNLYDRALATVATFAFIGMFVFLYWYGNQRPDFDAIQHEFQLELADGFAAQQQEGKLPPAYVWQGDKDYIEYSRQLFHEGAWTAAAVQAAIELQHSPGDPNALYRQGIAYERMGNFKSAERAYLAAVNAGLDTWIAPEALINLARIYLKTSDYNKAVHYALQATRVAPDYVRAWNMAARAYSAIDNVTSAQHARDRAIQLQTRAERLKYGIIQ